MRSILIASFFGLFLTLSVIGVLSVSPLLDSPVADQKVASFLDHVFPKKKVDPLPKTQERATITHETNAKVLGLQTNSSTITANTLYGLINGARRDKRREALTVSPLLEKAALELSTNRVNQENDQYADPESTIKNSGYSVGNFALLEARSVDSNWAALNYWQSDPRDELLLHSSFFQDMGVSVLCNPQASYECTVLLVIATPR